MIVCITKPNFHDIMHKIIAGVKIFFKGMGLGIWVGVQLPFSNEFKTKERIHLNMFWSVTSQWID